MSLGWCALLFAALAPPPDARVAIVVGNDLGLESEEPLDYAEADARRFHQLLLDVGEVRPERAYLVVGGDAAALRSALQEATGRLLELRRQGPSSLILYVSAHADQEALHLGGSRFPISELRAALARTGADLRLAIIDGCNTAVAVKQRGGRPVPDVEVVVDRTAQVEGDLLIRAAGSGEGAQEWTYLRGGLFTHHLSVGLRGLADIDEDGRVSLAEAYAYAYRKTVAKAVSGAAGAQHPSFDFTVRGFGEWVFSRPEQLGSTIVLGASISGAVWIADRKNELVAELSKAGGEVVKVAVRPGWYRVVRPEGRTAGAADLNLGFGGARLLEREDFVDVPLGRAALRGGEAIVLRPWSLRLSYGLGGWMEARSHAEHRLGLELSRALGPLWVRAGVAGALGAYRRDPWAIDQRSLRASLGAGLSWSLGLVALSAGVGARLEWVHQSLHRPDAEAIFRVFGLREPDREALLLGGTGVLGASLALTDRLWLNVELELALLRVPEIAGVRTALDSEGRVSVAWTF